MDNISVIVRATVSCFMNVWLTCKEREMFRFSGLKALKAIKQILSSDNQLKKIDGECTNNNFRLHIVEAICP